MASRLVDELLRDIELLGEGLVRVCRLEDLRIDLRLLRTFLLFASGWHDDVRSRSDENTSSSSPMMMGSFLNRLEDSLIENGKNFHNLCLAAENEIVYGRRSNDLFTEARKLYNCICSFSQGVAESYITLSDYCTLQSWDQSLEVIDSLQANLADIVHQFHSKREPIEEVESLQERLAFFRNFIRFAQLRGFEPGQLQSLFTHLQVVAVNAARICHEFKLLDEFTFVPSFYERMWRDELKLKFHELLLKIKPVDPQIGETYFQVLMALKSSGSSHPWTLGTDRHVLGDFVGSLLLCNILEALTYRDSHIASLKDQIPMLYWELNFLRFILANHLEKIDELHKKVKDLVGAAVNEAAIVIFSLFVHELEQGLAKEMDFALLNFLEKIKIIKVITSAFIFPRTNEHGFVDFFLESLKELPSCKADSIVYARDQIHTVHEDLASLRLSFLEGVLDQRNQNGKLQSLWCRVAEVACKTRFVIESLVVGEIPDCSALEFNLIKEEINLIKKEASRINDNQYSSETQNVTETSSSFSSQGSTPTINKTEVTLDDEANTIIGQLKRGSKQLDIISIVGMPGIGKTTLARSVYDNPSVRDLFHTHAWCVISQAYEKKDLLLQILGCVDRNFSYDNYSKGNECELEEKLRQCLLRRRYLIVLDDIWDIDAWSGLVRSFPNDANSSRILLTSRHFDVAKKIDPTHEPHPLRLLNDEESWHLLQKRLSGKRSCPSNLLGKKIAKNCKGLPLTIVMVAGILPNLEEDGWVEIAERLSLSDLPIIGQCMDMLEVSYKTLPENLRSCLLYFGAFREDEEIPCKRLIWLWKAEGFVQKCEAKSLEDVAKDCMNDLIGRNWVMVSREKAIGGAKTCRIHDLLHEFCVVKAKKEKFLSVLSGRNELFNFYGQRDLQRLCIHSTSKDFEKSRLFCPSIRSLLYADDGSHHYEYRNISFIFHFCKLLKVLDLTKINLGHTFPSEIALLVELRYLAIYGDLISIPPVVANLSNLETLLFDAFQIFLPDTIWNLPKLRVLRSTGCIFLNSGLMPTNLHNLDTFSRMCVSLSRLEEIMRKLPNVRRLNCLLFVELEEFNADCKSIVVMDWLSKLESLDLSLDADEKKAYRIGFRFPLNIKKLTLSRFHSSIIPKSGELPNLVVLKLCGIYFEGNSWDMNKEWEFPKLKLLEMKSLKIVRWTGSDDVDHFPCLEKLVVQDCEILEEVPSCLGGIPTLQMIEVCRCGKFAANLFQKIKEEQNDCGNDIQVFIEKWEDELSEDMEEDDRDEEVEPSEDEEEEPSEDEEDDDLLKAISRCSLK